MLQVMLLDDDETIQELVTNLLSHMQTLNCHITYFDDFDEALNSLETTKYDVCLIDYDINDDHERTETEFISDVLRLRPFLPMIMLTGSGDYITMLDSLEVGAVDFIEKNHLRPTDFAKAFHYTLRRGRVLRELRALYQQVSLANQIKSDVIRLAAHDIKTPLTTSKLSVEYLNRMVEDEKQQRHIGRINKASDRINEIVTGVLTLDGIDDMDVFYDTDLFTLIHSVIHECHAEAREKNQTISYDATEKCPHVSGIPGQLREVVHNLISNAVKYTAENGNIEIRLFQKANTVCVNVSDNGCGIPLVEQVRLFQPFSRIISDETRQIEGSGLGLYLVKRIIERHGGTVYFESVYGKGSTFGFSLPIT